MKWKRNTADNYEYLTFDVEIKFPFDKEKDTLFVLRIEKELYDGYGYSKYTLWLDGYSDSRIICVANDLQEIRKDAEKFLKSITAQIIKRVGYDSNAS